MKIKKVSSLVLNASAILATILLIGIEQTAEAQDRWIDPGGGFWDDDFNWQDLSDPGPTDQVLFDLDSSYLVIWDGLTGDTESNTLRVNDGVITFRSQGGMRTHSVTGSDNSDVIIENARLNLGSSLSDAFHLRVSDDASVRAGGTLNIREGSTLTTLGLGTTNSSLSVTGFDSTATTSGIGRLNILAGGQAFSGIGIVHGDAISSDLSGGEAYARISGVGSLWRTSSFFTVGDAGIGVVTIENEGRLEVGAVSRVGAGSVGTGTINVTGSGSAWHAQSVSLGREGIGTINVLDDGYLNMAGILAVGTSGGSGRFVVSGDGSFANATGGLEIFGTSDFLIEDGGWMSVASIYSNPGAGHTSIITVDGSGSQLGSGETIARGASTIRVQNGADLISGPASIYSNIHGNASVDVSGPGSYWTVSGSLSLGRASGPVSAASMKVTNGADVFVVGNTTVHSGSSLTLADSSIFSTNVIVEGDVLSDGNVIIEGNVLTSGIDSGMMFAKGMTQITGDLSHQGPQIEIASDGLLVVGGNASGNGKYIGTGTVRFDGLLTPGSSPAVVEFGGDVQMGDLAISQFELAGLTFGEFDRLVIEGDLHADGELQLSMLDGFTLEDGMSFEFIDVGGLLTGQFDGLDEGSTVGIFAGHRLAISYMAGDGNDVGLYASAIPEPGSGVVLSILLGVSVLRRRGSSRQLVD